MWGRDREKRKMAETRKEVGAEATGQALSLRFLFELIGVNLQNMGKDHNTEKLGLGEACGGKRGGKTWNLGLGPAEPLVLPTKCSGNPSLVIS